MRASQVAAIFEAPGERHQRELIAKLVRYGESGRCLLALVWSKHAARPAVRRWVGEALCAFRDPQSSSRVCAALRDSHMSVRLHAVHGAIANYRTDLALAVRPLLQDESGAVRLRALDALVVLGAQDLEPILLTAMLDDKHYVQARALEYLTGRRIPSKE